MRFGTQQGFRATDEKRSVERVNLLTTGAEQGRSKISVGKRVSMTNRSACQSDIFDTFGSRRMAIYH